MISFYARGHDGPHPIAALASLERGGRYNSLAYAFDGDRGVRVIFDRRRAERRQQTLTPPGERRQEDRRSADRDWTLRSVGWVQILPDSK
jgi:hypothetical protein